MSIRAICLLSILAGIKFCAGDLPILVRILAAGGNIYFTSLDGAVTVLKAGSKEPAVVATGAKLDQRTAATPAIADDTPYLRTEAHLYAFAQTKSGHRPREPLVRTKRRLQV